MSDISKDHLIDWLADAGMATGQYGRVEIVSRGIRITWMRYTPEFTQLSSSELVEWEQLRHVQHNPFLPAMRRVKHTVEDRLVRELKGI